MKLQWSTVAAVGLAMALAVSQGSGQPPQGAKKGQPAKPAPAADSAKAGASAFDGKWRFVAISAEGQQIPPEAYRGDTLEIKGDQFTLRRGGAAVRGTLKLQPAAGAVQVDMTYSEGENKGETLQGICQVSGRTALFAWGTGKNRATTLSGGPGQMLWQLGRVQ